MNETSLESRIAAFKSERDDSNAKRIDLLVNSDRPVKELISQFRVEVQTGQLAYLYIAACAKMRSLSLTTSQSKRLQEFLDQLGVINTGLAGLSVSEHAFSIEAKRIGIVDEGFRLKK